MNRIFLSIALGWLGACAAPAIRDGTSGSTLTPPAVREAPQRVVRDHRADAIDEYLLHAGTPQFLVGESPGVFALAEAETGTADASMSEAEKQAELARKIQNPVSSLISLPIQNNTGFNFGAGDDVQNVLNIQPVYPVSISENWNLVNRAILPVIYQPAPVPGASTEFGLGDTYYTAFLSPKKSGKIIWGVGPTILIPTSTADTLGVGEWGAGVSGVALTMKGPWVVGVLVGNAWSFEGNFNQLTLQPFVNYNFEHGWYVTSVPLITANWEASGGDVWTVPVGGGVGRLTKVGKQPMNFQLQAFYNVASPSVGPEWTLRFQVQFLFPK
jgi:hypothetical protein